MAMLLDDEGQVIARAPVHELRSQAGDCGCGGHGGEDDVRFPVIVQALVPDVERGSALVIRSGQEELWTREASRRPPRVREFTARNVKDAIKLSWEVEAETGEPEVWVHWKAGGERAEWRALATGLTGGRADVAISLLPPGTCSLRLLAGDGFHTSISKQVRLRVPERGPDVAILTPLEGETLVAGNPMRLHGAATDPRGDEKAQHARWLIDRKEAASGLDAFITAPPAGRHTLELAVGSGRRLGRATIGFVTIDIEREARRQRQHLG
ncbi:MAG: hypothetical protein ACRDNP_11080 [Gaiellaceae bacterium]